MKKLINKLLVLCVLCCALVLCAFAAETTTSEDGLWVYKAYSTGVELVEYKGTATDVYAPAKVDGKAVLKLGDSLFANNDSLNSVTLGVGITEIGTKPFYDCDQLVCIVTNDELTTIGAQAFDSCDNFNSIILKNNVTTIAATAFDNCPKLTIWCNEGNAAYTHATTYSIPYELLSETAEPEMVTVDGIEYYIQNGTAIAVGVTDKTITEATVPAAVNNYPVVELRETFADCTKLTAVTLPDSLTVIGKNAFRSCYSLTGVVIPDSITSIGEHAFAACGNLANIRIPNGVKIIGEYAFYECDKLTSIIIPEGVTTIERGAFIYCNNLIDVVISDTVKTIGTSSFADCTSLTSVIIPSGVTKMYADSFPSSTVLCVTENSYAHQFSTEENLLHFLYDGVNMPEVYLDNNIIFFIQNGDAIAVGVTDLNIVTTDIPESINGYPVRELKETFAGCERLVDVTLPNTLEVIGKNSFFGCRGLSNICIPNSVKTIGEYAFYECVKLTSVEIPDGVTTIERGAFIYCDNLVNVKISDSVKYIGSSAFYRCKSLATIAIPDGISTIESGAFDGCSGLKNVLVPRCVNKMYIDSFPISTVLCVYENSYAHTFAAENNLLCFVSDGISTPDILEEKGIRYFVNDGKALAVGVIDKTITTATVSAMVDGYPVVELRETFMDCNMLEKVILPDSLKVIGKNAFLDCYSLTDVLLPDSVTTINEYAFSACYSLTDIAFPPNLSKIEYRSFIYCNSLTSVAIPNGVTVIDNGAFFQCESLSSVLIPDSVKSIGDDAFSECSNLVSIVIPDSVTGMYAESFPASAVLCVYEDSYAHTFAEKNNLLYFVLYMTENPEVSYGTGLTGTVTYMDGTAAAGMTVEAIYDDGTVKETVTTDENGAYEFTYAEVGRYTVRATDTTGNTASTTVSVKRMNVFDVYVSGDTALTLKKGYTVSGTVSESATVTLTDKNGNVLQTADAAGTFSFANVPNGEYILKAESENGSITQEITVFNGDVSGIALTLPEAVQTAAISGTIAVEKRDGTTEARNWADVTLYSGDTVVARMKSDTDGSFLFEKLPLGVYTISAEVTELRPSLLTGADVPHTLTGYAYIEANEAEEYAIGTIVLKEKAEGTAAISGKVTANGETQDCTVTLRDDKGNELVSHTTGNNGHFTFLNVPDGQYFVTARTKSDGFGYTSVVVTDGTVYGDLHIKVLKSSKVAEMEYNFGLDVPVCANAQEAEPYRARIAAEKDAYDALSKKEKMEASEAYVERLEKLCAWLAQTQCTTNEEGVTVSQTGLIVSGDELREGESIEFSLTLEKKNLVPGENGIETEEDFIYYQLEENSGNKKIKQYYEITMTKDDGSMKLITDVLKDTDSNGKFRITMPIPEEYRGYKHYSLLHEHHGEIVTLADLDDDPNTITFEVDKFSTFALAVTNTELVEETAAAEKAMDVVNNLDITFSITAEGEGNYAVITKGETEATIQQADWTVTDSGYTVTYSGVAAKELTEDITISVHDAEGNLVSQQTTSAYDSIMNAMAGETDGSKLALYEAVLHYGAAAQNYFDYNTGNLANKGLDAANTYLDTIRSELPEYRTDNSSLRGADTGVIYGTSCILGSKLQMKVYFTANDISVLIDGRTVELQQTENSAYYYVILDVAPEDIFTPVSITVQRDGKTVATAQDSIASYCARLYKVGDANLADAILLYGLAAKAEN